MKRSRAYVRESKRKAKEKVKHIAEDIWGMSENDFPTKRDYEKWLSNMTSTHGKPCSCFLCGNPRRFDGEETIQEKKFKDEEDMQIEEVLDES